MQTRSFTIALFAWLAATGTAGAQVVVYDKGDQRVAVAGAIQPEYWLQQPEDDQTRDRVFLRRMILDLQGSVSTWAGSFQVDFGQGVSVKNAYAQYTGWRSRGLLLTIGNQKFPYSRSFVTSGARRNMPERPFTGDRNYGTPNRALGVKIDGTHADRRIQWSAAIGAENQIANPRQIVFDSPVAPDTTATTEGMIAVGRLEWHPFGETPRDQGDFDTQKWRVVLATAAYRWWNDHDRQAAAGGDLEKAQGLEASGGLRGHRVSLDLEVHRIRGEALTAELATGLYAGGIARLRKGSLDAGYMVVNHRLEIVGSLESLDADAYARPWRRAQAGAAIYFRDHSVNLEVTHRASAHVNGGTTGLHETIAQLQFVF